MYLSQTMDEALRRFNPYVVALSSETKDLVEFSPIFVHMAKDKVKWQFVFLLDRLEVCHWFVGAMSDEPQFAATVSEVKLQLPPISERFAVPDSHLSSICLKHRIMHLALDREKKRLQALEAEQQERQDLIDQFMEDGLSEEEATAEADRELSTAEAFDEEEASDPPPIVVILKGFLNHAMDLLILDRVGVKVAAVIVLNSAARFGKKEEPRGALLDAKETKGVSKKKSENKKSDLKRVKGIKGHDEVETLQVQVMNELAKLGPFDSSPLRETLFWTYETMCTEMVGTIDGGDQRAYIFTESETSICEKIVQQIWNIVEIAKKFREWESNKTFIRIPMLKVKPEAPEVSKFVVLVPPVVKTAKKTKHKADVEIVKEETVVSLTQSEIPHCVALLPTCLKAWNKVIRSSAYSSDWVVASKGIIEQVKSALADRSSQNECLEKQGITRESLLDEEVNSAEDSADSFCDYLLGTLRGETANILKKIHVSKVLSVSSEKILSESIVSNEAEIRIPPGTNNVSGRFLHQTASTSYVEAIRQLSKMAWSIYPLCASEGTDCLKELCVKMNEKTLPSSFKVISRDECENALLHASLRGELEGLKRVLIHSSDNTCMIGYTSNNPETTSTRFLTTWHLFHGRIPFPIFVYFTRYCEAEDNYYRPDINDVVSEHEIEEDEEEEEMFDDDGVLIPREIKTYPIVRKNFSALHSSDMRRRGIYDSIKDFLNPIEIEVLQANNHVANSLFDESQYFYPADGTTICARQMKCNSDVASATVFTGNGDICFGFHGRKGQPYTGEKKPMQNGAVVYPEPIDSNVMCFFSAVGNAVRLTIEASVHDPAPPIVGSPKIVETHQLEIKKGNSPRSKKIIDYQHHNVTQIEDIQNTHLAIASHIPKHDPPVLNVNLTVGSNLCVAISKKFVSFSDKKGTKYKLVVYLEEFHTLVDIVRKRVLFPNGSVLVSGDHSKAVFYIDGSIATNVANKWLLTSPSGTRRVLMDDGKAISVPPVDGAVQISPNGLREEGLRDDGVSIIQEPSYKLIKFPDGTTFRKGCYDTRENTTIQIPDICVTVVHELMQQQINFSSGVVLTRNLDYYTLQCNSSHNCFIDFISYKVFIKNSEGSPKGVYTIDCLYGGLRSTDGTYTYHVTPFGRSRRSLMEVEEAPTPADLTVRNVVDVFIDEPELLNDLFVAAASAAGVVLEENAIHLQRNVPLPPSYIKAPYTTVPIVNDNWRSTISEFEKERSSYVISNTLAYINDASGYTSTRSRIFIKSANGQYLEAVTAMDVNVLLRLIKSESSPLRHIYTKGVPFGKVGVILMSAGDESEFLSTCLYKEKLLGGRLMSLTEMEDEVTFLSPESPSIFKKNVCYAHIFFIPKDGSVITDIGDASNLLEESIHDMLGSMSGLLKAPLGLMARSVTSRHRGRRATEGQLRLDWPNPIESLRMDLIRQLSQKFNYWETADRDLLTTLVQKKYTSLPSKEADSRLKSQVGLSLSGDKRMKESMINTVKPAPVLILPKRPNFGLKKHQNLLAVTPITLHLGAMIEGFRYTTYFSVTNISIKPCRYRVTSSNSMMFSIEYQKVPIAPGITVNVEIEVRCSSPGSKDEQIIISNEEGALVVPVFLDVQPSGSKFVLTPESKVRMVGPI